MEWSQEKPVKEDMKLNREGKTVKLGVVIGKASGALSHGWRTAL